MTRAAMTIFLEGEKRKEKVAISPEGKSNLERRTKTAYFNPRVYSPLHTQQVLFIGQHP